MDNALQLQTFYQQAAYVGLVAAALSLQVSNGWQSSPGYGHTIGAKPPNETHSNSPCELLCPVLHMLGSAGHF